MKQNWTEVKKQLKYCSENDFLGVIQDLYKLNKEVKDYLHARFIGNLGPENKEILVKAEKTKLIEFWKKAFYDPYGFSGKTHTVRVTEAKKILTNYKKAIGDDAGYVALCFVYSVWGIDFIADIERCTENCENVNNSVISVLSEALSLIKIDRTSTAYITDADLQKSQEVLDEYHKNHYWTTWSDELKELKNEILKSRESEGGLLN